ncbi:MAG: acyltransferase [Actinobacteria bacterium]|nr:acyltransferase [Actinomycetota bacterium]
MNTLHANILLLSIEFDLTRSHMRGKVIAGLRETSNIGFEAGRGSAGVLEPLHDLQLDILQLRLPTAKRFDLVREILEFLGRDRAGVHELLVALDACAHLLDVSLGPGLLPRDVGGLGPGGYRTIVCELQFHLCLTQLRALLNARARPLNLPHSSVERLHVKQSLLRRSRCRSHHALPMRSLWQPRTTPTACADAHYPHAVTSRSVPALDALRAVAIIAVIAYHLDLASVPGGFLGVDVFFVLSGYLITWILLTTVAALGRIDFKVFYEARARRLIPAFVGVVFAVCLIGSLCAPDTIPKFFSDLPWASTGTVNWWYVVNETSYFEETARPPLLQHMWSLAVEAQFYLIWPLVVAFFGRRSWIKGMRWFAAASAAVFAAMSISLGVNIEHASALQASNFYFGTGSRCVGLLLGAALAAGWTPIRLTPSIPPRARLFIDLVAVFALASLGYLFWSVDEVTLHWFAWGSPLAALVTAVAIAALVHPACRVSRVLSRPALLWVGTRSYGLYLWHWPVLQLLRPGIDVAWPDSLTNATRVAVTALLAEASYRWLELPIRQRRNPFAPLLDSYRNPRTRRFVAASVTTILIYPALALSRDAYATAKVEEQGFLAQFAAQAVATEPALAPVAPRPGATVRRLRIDTRPRLLPPSNAGSATSIATAAVAPSSSPSPAPVDPTVNVAQPAAQSPMSTEDPLPTTSPTPDATATSRPSASEKAGSASALNVARKQGVWVVGDSVLVGAMRVLRAKLPVSRNDAEVGMQANVVFHTLRDGATAVKSDVVVLNIGNNGTVREKTLRRILTSVRDRTVVLVDAVVPRRWESANNALVRDVLPDFPNVRLVAWSKISQGHPEYFAHDGIHLTASGAARYVDAIVGALAAE